MPPRLPSRSLLVLVAVLGVALAHAAPPRPTGEPAPASSGAGAAEDSSAEAIYERAQEHYLAKRYTEALALFQQLLAQSGSPNARLYVARCLREIGRLPEAHQELERTVREAEQRARAEPRFEGTRDAARTELSALQSKLGRVTVVCPHRPVGLEIELNGKLVAPDRLQSPIPVMPGRARLRASAPGFKDIRTEHEVQAGTAQTIRVDLQPQAAPALAPTPTSAERSQPLPSPTPTGEPDGATPPEEPGTPGTLTGGIVMLGLAVLGGVAWGVAGTMAEDRYEEIVEECNNRRCSDPAINDSISEGRTMDYVATGGAALTVVAVVLSGVLFTVYGLSDDDDGSAEPAEPPVGLRLGVTPTGAFVGLHGAF